MLPAALTVIILLAALGLAFAWLHLRIAKVEDDTADISQWITESERDKRAEPGA
jgi:hypothetical protein